MVKVDNVFGDITTGRQGEAVYQRKYGRGMRRLFNDLNKNPSQSQLDQRANFKRSIAWVKGLSYAEKQAIKEYCRINRVGYKDGEPIHWYNWAKRLGIARPKFKVVDSVTGKYRVSHPALYRIEEIDKTGAISFSIDELSDVLDSRYLGVYEQTPGTPISMVRVTTLPGIVFDYPIGLVMPITSKNCLLLECFDLITPCPIPPTVPPYHYYDEYTIVGSSSGELTNYPFVPLPFYYHKDKVQPGFNDVRWYLDDGVTPLDYHCRSKVDGYLANYCVKIPLIPEYPETIKIRAYYGDSTAVSVENPHSVYRFFDDFLGSSLDTTNWTRRSGTVTVANSILRLDTGVVQHNTSFNTPLAFDYMLKGVHYTSGDKRIGMNINGYSSDPTYATYWFYNMRWQSCCNWWFNRAWITPILVSLGTGINGKMALYLDDVLVQQNTNDSLPNPSKPGLQAGTFSPQWMDVDWFAVRDVDRNPPTLTNIQTLGEI